MRKLVLVIALLWSANAFAQKFEGTVKWAIKTDINDPKQKAQMEDAQKKMNDPATQAQMKAMQEKMNDPQFKAMMEANPQMKAQMMQMMGGVMQNGGNINAMMPTGFTIRIKDDNALTKFEGGMFAGEFLYIKAKDQAYSLDRQNKTYSIMNPPSETSKKESDVKVTKTKETTKVLNYNCTKYIVEITDNGNKLVQNIWATSEIKDFDLKSMSKQKFGKDKMYFDKIDGVPLKIEMNSSIVNMAAEATEIKKETLNAEDFIIPADYKEVQGMFR